MTDVGIALELESQTKNLNSRSIACKNGCFACCLNAAVPINQIEILGISWYVTEILDDETYSKITPQLINHKDNNSCCFLLDGACSIYPVRPIACRTFSVFGEPCKEYEDISKTRPEDIAHLHTSPIAWMVSQELMPHMGITKKAEQIKAFNDGFMIKKSRHLNTIDWSDFKIRTENGRKMILSI